MASGTIMKKGLKKIHIASDTISSNGFATRVFYDTDYPNANFVGCIGNSPDFTARIVRISANTGYVVQFIKYDGTLPISGAYVTYDLFYYDN